MKMNSLSVIQFLLKYLKIQISKTSILEELEKHPNDHSLLAISDTLSHWHVANVAYNLNSTDLHKLPVPFIAHLSSRGGEFALIEKLTENSVTVSNEHLKKHQLDKEEFEKSFTGNVLIAEAADDSGEKDYKKRRQDEILSEMRIPFVVSGIIIIFLLTAWIQTFSVSVPSWRNIILMFLKVSGVITSVFLLIHSVDSNNPFIRRLCTGGNGRNCNSILSSKAAKVTSFLSWSEVGFFYFTGSLLVMLFAGIEVLPSLAVINLCCLPYTAYSFWYQFRIAKQWCPLCCTVQTLLWLEFITLFPYLYSGSTFFSFSIVVALLISFSLPVLSWSLVKPWLLKSQQIQSIKRQLKGFKYNDELFRKLLSEQPRQEMPDAGNSIILGNPDAEQVITVVSNPYCQPCSRAHMVLDECFSGRDDVKLQVIFSTANKEKDSRTKVAAHMVALYKQKDLHITKKALDDWYSQKQKNYEEWAKVYPAEAGISADPVLEEQKDWCKKAEIKGTPTIFINGYSLPDLYSPEDVRYFI